MTETADQEQTEKEQLQKERAKESAYVNGFFGVTLAVTGAVSWFSESGIAFCACWIIGLLWLPFYLSSGADESFRGA